MISSTIFKKKLKCEFFFKKNKIQKNWKKNTKKTLKKKIPHSVHYVHYSGFHGRPFRIGMGRARTPPTLTLRRWSGPTPPSRTESQRGRKNPFQRCTLGMAKSYLSPPVFNNFSLFCTLVFVQFGQAHKLGRLGVARARRASGRCMLCYPSCASQHRHDHSAHLAIHPRYVWRRFGTRQFIWGCLWGWDQDPGERNASPHFTKICVQSPQPPRQSGCPPARFFHFLSPSTLQTKPRLGQGARRPALQRVASSPRFASPVNAGKADKAIILGKNGISTTVKKIRNRIFKMSPTPQIITLKA